MKLRNAGLPRGRQQVLERLGTETGFERDVPYADRGRADGGRRSQERGARCADDGPPVSAGHTPAELRRC
ncbi:hypothetical protein Arub01_43110 [Actinomadura rubrobrunea]|uniref:Uncharacterized protein n=1 Tax=Actinomadura rubrobrunea TaxID=115335 RepID=A0A9W6PYD2_9ACTN|nr:hypothetical protein Arub01_43110 [Actinomadura rubrobrunea]